MDDTNVATAEPVSSPITNRYEKSADGQEIIDHHTGLAWRVPRVDELASLVDRNLTYPASSFPDRLAHVFWSSSPYVGSTDLAWGVGFYDGGVGSSYRDCALAVRLVRGG